jgi:hypothetical protein
MATESKIKELIAAIQLYSQVDRTKLLRANLGDESMSQQLMPILAELDKKAEFATKYASGVPDTTINQIKDIYTAIASLLGAQSTRQNQEYIANKPGILQQLASLTESLLSLWPPVVSAAVLDRGFLEDEGIRKEYASTVLEMKAAASDSIENIKTETKKALEEARKLADEIETKARRTATKISVKEAQDQFSSAQSTYGNQIKIWAGLSILAFLILIGLICWFINTETLPKEWSWQVAYYSALHITALGVAGAFTSFCLRIFRSQLHMYQLNLHRQRVANSIEAFVESAITPEQRDFILARLVDAVVSFGNSGLLNDDSSDSFAPKLTIDNISRTITGAIKEPSK